MSKRKSQITSYQVIVISYLLTGLTPLTGSELTNIVVRNSAGELLLEIE
jgi:hypothetical protein